MVLERAQLKDCEVAPGMTILADGNAPSSPLEVTLDPPFDPPSLASRDEQEIRAPTREMAVLSRLALDLPPSRHVHFAATLPDSSKSSVCTTSTSPASSSSSTPPPEPRPPPQTTSIPWFPKLFVPFFNFFIKKQRRIIFLFLPPVTVGLACVIANRIPLRFPSFPGSTAIKLITRMNG